MYMEKSILLSVTRNNGPHLLRHLGSLAPELKKDEHQSIGREHEEADVSPDIVHISPL
jgi:hypothetical protein